MQTSRKEQLQTVAKQAMAIFAATQLLAAPIAGLQSFLCCTPASGSLLASTEKLSGAGPALAFDLPDVKGAFDGLKPDKTGAAVGGAISGQGQEKKGPTVRGFVCSANTQRNKLCLINSA